MLEATLGRDSAKASYEAMAPVYDSFTEHYDTELWLGKLIPELERCGLQGNRLLDVGCGTGNSFLPMIDRGWSVVGCDISTAMLSKAAAKVGDQVRLELADMRALPAFGSFDLVWALDDAVNYLLSLEELRSAFEGMAKNLAANGLLMFDVNTLATYRGFFAETVVIERHGCRLIWRGQSDSKTPPRSISEARFEVEGTAVESHQHRQRHFPEADIRAALIAAGLRCLAVFGHHEDVVMKQPLDEDDHVKAVYIAALAA